MAKVDKIGYCDADFKLDMLKLKHRFKESNFDAVFAPVRGGLTMGVKLSHILNIPLGIIEYQRLDSTVTNPAIKLVVDPITKDGRNFTFMTKILLVDDICDTGYTIEKMVKFLRLLNPAVEITVVTLFGNKNSTEVIAAMSYKFDFTYLRDNENKWVTFQTWEDDFNICKWCNEGEACNINPGIDIHCNLQNKSFPQNHCCEDFSLYGERRNR